VRTGAGPRRGESRQARADDWCGRCPEHLDRSQETIRGRDCLPCELSKQTRRPAGGEEPSGGRLTGRVPEPASGQTLSAILVWHLSRRCNPTQRAAQARFWSEDSTPRPALICPSAEVAERLGHLGSGRSSRIATGSRWASGSSWSSRRQLCLSSSSSRRSWRRSSPSSRCCSRAAGRKSYAALSWASCAGHTGQRPFPLAHRHVPAVPPGMSGAPAGADQPVKLGAGTGAAGGPGSSAVAGGGGSVGRVGFAVTSNVVTS
jgi:hypothetical protein